MKKIAQALVTFFSNPRNVFILGMLVAIVATALETFRGRCTNYYDYRDSTVDFFNGICVYTAEWVVAHKIYFLYTPNFNFLFAPVAYSPWWLGPFIWNLANYSLFFLSIWTLPKQYADHRLKIFLFLLLVLEQSIFCYQFNTVVCYIFLFAFTLMERGKFFWAVLLIMYSACTKIYGGIELGLLLCYPRFWRHMGYAALCGIMFFFLPVLKVGFDGLLPLYQSWLDMIASHHSDADFVGLLFAPGFKQLFLADYRLFQLGVLAVLGVLFFWHHDRWSDFKFRAHVLGVLMGYVILLSDCPETHTYIIALSGYMLCYWLWDKHTVYDKVLFWSMFVLFGMVPSDVLCPVSVHEFLHADLWLDVFGYTLVWLEMIWVAVRPSGISPASGKPAVE
jgi:hypothetical protein